MAGSGISLSLGLGGGKTSTATSGSGGGGAPLTDNLAYPNGLYTDSNFVLSVQPTMHFDAFDMNGNNDGSGGWSDGDEITTGAGNIWVERSQRDGTYDGSQGSGANEPTFTVAGSDKYVRFNGGLFLNLASSLSKAAGTAWTIANISQTDDTISKVFNFAPNVDTYGSIQLGKWSDNNVYAKAIVLASSQDYRALDMRLVQRDTSNLVTLFTSGNNSQGTATVASTFVHDSIGKSGNTARHEGNMSEILFFDSILTTLDKNVLRLFFANKYSTLPTLAAWT